jgi:O-antigen/teichoic acid export membrane protein
MASQTLKQRTIDSVIWTLLGYGSSQIVRFAANLIMARILEPQYFGLMAIVNIILLGVILLSDVGIVQSIINNPRGEERDFLDTAWTAQLCRSVVLWGFCLLLAWPAAQLYQDNRLLMLIPVAGISSLIDGFQTTRMFVAQRRLEQRRYNLFELLRLTVAAIVMVGLAFWLQNIWALVIAGLVQSVVSSVSSYYFFPGPRHRFCWDANAVKEITSLGRWVFLASATMFAADQLDRLILAKLVDWSTIGVYSIAYNLSSLPRELIKTLSYRVIYPAAASQASLPRPELRQKIIKQRRLLLLSCVLILAALVTLGDLVITVLYNEKYAQAIWMMPILCFGIWFSVLFNSMSNVLVAVNKPLYTAHCYTVRLVIIAIILPVGFYVWGLPGAIVAIALSDFPPYLVNLWGLRQEKLSCLWQDVEFSIYFFGFLAICLATRYGLGFGYPIQRLIGH